MGTPYQKIYEAFLSQIESDEWEAWELLEAEEDWRQLLDASLPLFRFPRIDLETRDNSGFKREVGNREIQVLVGFMKAVWLERVVNSWENLKPLYSERDFSPATMLNELRLKSTRQWKLAEKRERTYYRVEDGEPFKYSKMAGRGYIDV